MIIPVQCGKSASEFLLLELFAAEDQFVTKILETPTLRSS